MTYSASRPGLTDEVDALAGALSGSFNILGRRVGLRSTSTQFAQDAQRFLRSFSEKLRASSAPEMTLSIVVAPPGTPDHPHTICRDGQAAWKTNSYWRLFRLLEWQLLSFLSEHVVDRYLIHGGAVGQKGFGIILPGASESGKSTLTQALVLRGFDYYSDELAVLDPFAGLLEPFAKPISCKDPQLFPALSGTGSGWFGPETNHGDGVWYWHPDELRPDGVGRPVPVRFVVFPRYDSAAAPALKPLTPGETMSRLLPNSVNFAHFDGSGLKFLAWLARTTTGFSLVSNSPQAAAELVSRLD